jgi:hypothetical protein
VFAIPGLVLLVLVDYFKPQEFIPAFAGLPLLHVLTLATLAGLVVDLRLGVSRLVPAPQLGLAVAFVGWCFVSLLPRGGQILGAQAIYVVVPFIVFVLVAHAIQTFRGLEAMMLVVMLLGLALALTGAHQGVAPWGCHRIEVRDGARKLVFDGRPCNEGDRNACRSGEAEPGVDYQCERVGLFGTQSIAGRVRFRGTMEDPNELSLAVGVVIPLAFAFYDRKRSAVRLATVVATIALAGVCAVFTKSRGGQIVFLVVLGVYFLKRFGVRGFSMGLVFALPVLLLGGRGTDEAAASTLERLECWSRGMELFRQSPLLGVGFNQFPEHHYLTAHNAYVLTAAELGLPGMLLWSSIVYLSIKIPIVVLRTPMGPAAAPEAEGAPSWALAMLAALAGVAGGMFFLSYAYKDALWLYLGLSAALYQAARRHRPDLRVRFGLGDLLVVLAIDLAIIVGVTALTRLKLGHFG